MADRCGGCTFWQAIVDRRDSDFDGNGECSALHVVNYDDRFGRLTSAPDRERDRDMTLVTREDFGCVLFAARPQKAVESTEKKKEAR